MKRLSVLCLFAMITSTSVLADDLFCVTKAVNVNNEVVAQAADYAPRYAMRFTVKLNEQTSCMAKVENNIVSSTLIVQEDLYRTEPTTVRADGNMTTEPARLRVINANNQEVLLTCHCSLM